MKYIVALLLVSFLLITACGAKEVIDPVVDDDVEGDDLSDDEVIDEIVPELIDPDEDLEIGGVI